MFKFINTNSINAVGAGQTATLGLSTGNKYHKLVLNYKANAIDALKAAMESDIIEIRLKINGKIQREFSAAQLFSINEANGHSVTSGKIEIFFAEPSRRSAAGEDALAWGMADVTTFQVEIDIAAGAVAPQLSASVLVDPMNTPVGSIVKWRRRNIPITATGVQSETGFDKQNAYYRIFCFTTDIDAITVKLDQEDVLDGTVEDLTAHYLSNSVATPAGTTLIAFDSDQRVSSALSMYKNKRPVSEFLVKFDMGAAVSFDTVSQLFGRPD